MLRMQGDLLAVLNLAAHGRLDAAKDQVGWSTKSALCVVMAANGYPGSYEKNTVDAGEIVSVGGRVLGVAAIGRDVEEAQRRAYMGVNKIDWPGGFSRTDIGWRAV